MLRESFREPTRCRELTSRWPDFVGIVDASSHGVGGVDGLLLSPWHVASDRRKRIEECLEYLGYLRIY